jgi:hypothetical protein
MVLMLENSELLDLGEKLQGVCIECLDGRCWLTQAGDSRDHLLGAGDSFTIRTGGRLIITATKACRLKLCPQPHGAKRPVFLHALTRELKSCAVGT